MLDLSISFLAPATKVYWVARSFLGALSQVIVPADAPHEVTLDPAKLSGSGADVSVVLACTNAPMTQVATTGAVDGAGKYHVAAGTGLVTFHSADAGKVVEYAYYGDAQAAVARDAHLRACALACNTAAIAADTSSKTDFVAAWPVP